MPQPMLGSHTYKTNCSGELQVHFASKIGFVKKNKATGRNPVALNRIVGNF